MTPERYGAELFLSYDRADASVVEEIASWLADAGVQVWFDRWELAPGDPWDEQLRQALTHATAIGLCLGRRGASNHQSDELDAALAQEQASHPRAVIPILLPGAEASVLPDTVGALASVDLSEGLNARPMQRLLATVVLERSRRILGEDHPETLTAANNVALALADQGDLESARQLQEEVLERRRRVLGEDHTDTLTAAGNLAASLLDLGELASARELQEKVLERSRRILGAEHPDTLKAASHAAEMLRASERPR